MELLFVSFLMGCSLGCPGISHCHGITRHANFPSEGAVWPCCQEFPTSLGVYHSYWAFPSALARLVLSAGSGRPRLKDPFRPQPHLTKMEMGRQQCCPTAGAVLGYSTIFPCCQPALSSAPHPALSNPIL
ncbi:hypothetical protein B0T18DRAFT_105009 [Schizothecium vesticola]|uniref:Secreted protein n=1 Tax=Schizothecium vesticola TaxID=314040 RepID=A0AA40F1E0_9PEZI|nr:hypothetical protein B0T18DRAFT_105009 [Schizothecium vesticola]